MDRGSVSMMGFWRQSLRWSVAMGALAVSCVTAEPVAAQVVLDGTVGSGVRQTLTPTGNQIQIGSELGTIRTGGDGSNLFHSFEQFSIGQDLTAVFSGPAHVTHVISRVTGQAVSRIDGTLRSTIAGANFYLINPHGVVFGPRAQLDVSGSFAVSTADALHLGAEGVFTASTDPAQTVLTSAPPSAFGFLPSNRGASVTVSGAELTAPADQALSVVAGQVQINGGTVRVDGGSLNLVAAGPGQNVPDAPTAQAQAALSDFVGRGDIVVEEGSVIGVDGPDPGGRGGHLVIRGGTLTIDRSEVSNRTFGDGDGGVVDIAVAGLLTVSNTGRVSVENEGLGRGAQLVVRADRVNLMGRGVVAAPTGLSSTVHEPGGGDGGAIRVQTRRLSVTGGAQIQSVNRGSGNSGGDVTVAGLAGQPAESVVIGDREAFSASRVSTQTIRQFDGGNGGDVSIQTEALHVLHGGSVSSSATGIGRGGDLLIDADALVIDALGEQQTGIAARAEAIGTGTARGNGLVQLTTADLSVTGGGGIRSTSIDQPFGGQIQIDAQRVRLTDAGTQIAVLDRSRGLAGQQTPGQTVGRVTVRSGIIEVVSGAQITASTNNRVRGGTLEIHGSDLILLDGRGSATATGLIAGPARGSRGNGGNIIVGDVDSRLGDLLILSGAEISVETLGTGDGGQITIGVDTATIANDGRITSTSRTSASAGQITLVANGLVLMTDRAAIATSAPVQGANGGDLTISSGTEIKLVDSQISAQAALDGGNVNLFAVEMVDLVNSRVTAAAGNNGGNIMIDPRFVVLSNSRLIADAAARQAGNITIVANAFIRSSDSVLSATGGDPSLDGQIEIISPDADLSGSLVQLPGSLLDTKAQLQPHCAVQFGLEASSFTQMGRGGTPLVPSGWLPSVDLAAPPPGRGVASSNMATSVSSGG